MPAKRIGAGTGTEKVEPGVTDKSSALVEPEFRGYINVDLTEDEKAEFERWVSENDMWALLDGIVSSGHRCSVKFDAKGGGYISSIACLVLESVNGGFVVTARGSTPSVSLCRVVYLVAVILGESWRSRGRMANNDRW